MDYPRLKIDRRYIMRDGSIWYGVIGMDNNVIFRAIRELDSLSHVHYDDKLCNIHNRSKDIMAIMNNGETEWFRPKEEVWREVTLDELIKIREPVRIRIIKENTITEGSFCIYRNTCTECKFYKSDATCNTQDTLLLVAYRDVLKIEMKVEE